MSDTLTNTSLIRRRWRLAGQVQGVGFRPFVYRLARGLALGGFVRNDAHGVIVEVEGLTDRVDGFAERLMTERPPLAVYQHVEMVEVEARRDGAEFVIQPSQGGDPEAAVTVDTALCDDCRRELMDPSDRRHRYGLINCTNCGPRFSIVQRVPYDRPNTSMSGFDMCEPCRGQYTEPTDRRFHAQPIACHDCGPRVQLVDRQGRRLAGDPYEVARRLLRAGWIVAVKGIGGFHLAMRADDEAAVWRLRGAKRRDSKPFAVMAANLDEARRLVHLSDQGAAMLQSQAAPIVLARRRSDARIADSVAPDTHRLGVMLPYTPIQHLLFNDGGSTMCPLVMTSANVSDEPLVIDNDDALRRLGGMCDAILWHDRPIVRCVDDSVCIDMGDTPALPIRRARGYVPQAIELPTVSPEAGLCVGGELKNTIAVVRQSQAMLSHHLGDLKHPLALEHFKQAIEDMQDLFGVEPRWIAHDLHPQYLSTLHAKIIAEQYGLPLIGVQHHHAHAASVMAEHGITGPVLAMVCDGVGYGDDGRMWGGELMAADLVGYRRVASLREMTLPGGDAAARDTRRCGLALLHQIYGNRCGEQLVTRKLLPRDEDRRMLTTMIDRNVRCVGSSAMGRWIDGMAALLGVCETNHHEAQAAMALEALAAECTGDDTAGRAAMYRVAERESLDGPRRIDLSLLTKVLFERRAAGQSPAELAAMMHDQLALIMAEIIEHASARTGITTAALSGGVFCNQRLTDRLTSHLTERGLRVLRHATVPPTDGGLALGQAAIASARLAAGTTCEQGAASCV
ncbi:carbamoyltransferase HypF [Planctomycetales bacterium ZRK34]|nr:carbamoyltransferase HypF [Planctomycetales bacterium ZRK34]